MARRRFPYDIYDVPSLEVRIRAQGGPAIDLSGTVDSGASTTVLSVDDAEELGLNPADLRQAPDAIVANVTALARARWAYERHHAACFP